MKHRTETAEQTGPAVRAALLRQREILTLLATQALCNQFHGHTHKMFDA